MSMAAAPVATDLDRFLEAIWRPGDVREVRMPKGARGTDAGYFDDTSKLASAVTRFDGRENLYITINPAAPALLARAANRIAQGMRTTTSDVDIVERRWLPIDLDPVRPSGISASDDEREHALATARAVYGYLNGLGWPDPVTTMSGNGYWLLYPIELPNDDESKALIEGVLKHLSERFSSDAVSIDTTVSNAARIVALIGTMKVKGDATLDRPHRRSTLTFRPAELAPVSREMLETLTPTRPAIVVQRPFIRVARMPEGWVRDALQQKGIAFRETQRKGCTWYQLQQCPFHPDDDQGGDCGVGEDADGKGLGKCFHNRGVGKGYQEFKAMLGLETNVVQLTIVPSKPAGPEPLGMDAADLLALNLPPLRWIVPDLIPEGTTVLAAPPKVGKSCLVYQVAVEASIGGDLLGRRVTPGSVLYFALEDGKRRGQDRLRAVLAGRTMPRGRLEVRWTAPAIGQGLEQEIAAWVEDHPDAVMVAIDTLGKVRPPSSKGRNAYEVDVELFSGLQGLFRDIPVSLLIVHHSAKAKVDDFLASVNGTYGITGSADTIVVIDRKRQEQFGKINVTGRDVADASISARFDGLVWQEAPDQVSDMTFAQNSVYKAIEDRARPVYAAAIADQLELERTVVQKRFESLLSLGLIKRVEGGYIANRVTLNVQKAATAYLPPHSSPSKRESSEGGELRTRAHDAPAREDAVKVSEVDTSESIDCRDYENHRSFHRRTPSGFVCDRCEEDA